MKKLIVGLLIFFSSACFAQTGSVNFTWTGNGNPNLPACSSTVTNTCLTTFTISDITSLSSPVVISSSIAETATAYTLASLPTPGDHVYSLIISGKDQGGGAISSTAVTAKVTVPAITLNPPTGFSGTP